jgi:hypothetical protein
MLRQYIRLRSINNIFVFFSKLINISQIWNRFSRVSWISTRTSLLSLVSFHSNTSCVWEFFWETISSLKICRRVTFHSWALQRCHSLLLSVKAVRCSPNYCCINKTLDIANRFNAAVRFLIGSSKRGATFPASMFLFPCLIFSTESRVTTTAPVALLCARWRATVKVPSLP